MRTLALIAVICSAAPAVAEKEGNEESRKQAEMLFRTGERAFEDGKYAMAADAFERAFETLPLPAIAFSAAQAYRLEFFRIRDDKMLKRAVQLYRIYIEKQKSGGRVKDAIANLAELEPMLERAEVKGGIADMVRVERTALFISSPVKGAMGWVNGAAKKKLPFDIAVKAGRHSVAISAKGYGDWKRDVDVLAGQTRPVEGDLKALKMTVAVKTDAGAQIRVDGEPVGTAPLSKPIGLDAGSHYLTITRRGHKPYARRIKGARGEAVDIDAGLSTTRQRKVAWVFIGTGALFLSVGAIAGIQAGAAQTRANDLDDIRRTSGLNAEQLVEYQDAKDERDQTRSVAFGFLAAGALVGGAGALFYFLDNKTATEPPSEKTKTSKRIKLAPVVGPTQAGVALGGRF